MTLRVRSQIDHNRSQESNFEPAETTSDLELVSVLEVDHNLVTQEGGGGVIAPQQTDHILKIGDSVRDSLGNVEQVTRTAPGGWITSNGTHVSRFELESASYTKVVTEQVSLPEHAAPSEAQMSASMLIDFASDIFDNPQLLDELVEDWTKEFKREVWQFVPSELQQKYRALKQGARST